MHTALQPTVLVTGFEPFPGAPLNPTQVLIERLKRSNWAPHGFAIAPHVLPTRYDVFETALAPLINEIRPAAVVSFGLSAKCQGFTLERVARNAMAVDKQDAAGETLSSAWLDPLGAETRASALPLAAIAARLGDAGLPWGWSDDAGGYICNLVFYRTLSALVTTGVPSGFVHVPYTTKQHHQLGLDASVFCFDEDELIAGAKIVIEAAAESV